MSDKPHYMPNADRDALLEKLAQLVKEADLTEISYSEGDVEVVLSRQTQTVYAAAPAAPAAAAPAAAPQPASAPAAPAAADDSANAIKAPMVGTVYMAQSPDAEPFVKVGDTVKQGDTLLIIEAMKVMNPLPSPVSGTVQRIMVENGEPIEFDQPLMVIA